MPGSSHQIRFCTALDGVRIAYATAEDLPFDDRSFDAVISTFGVMFVAKPKAAAGGLARVPSPPTTTASAPSSAWRSRATTSSRSASASSSPPLQEAAHGRVRLQADGALVGAVGRVGSAGAG